jgi:integrase
MSEMEAADRITPSAEEWDDSGLSAAEKRAWLYQLQDGKCAVCGDHTEFLVVDHDHATGLVRGLLCWPCNIREGRPGANYLDIEAYRNNPPAADLGWMWDWPDPTRMSNGDLQQQAIVFMQQRVWDPEGASAGDAHSLLNVPPGRWLTEKRNRALIVALWRGGLRCGEALSLYPSDIDEQAGTINIRGEGKCGGTPRLVGIDPAAMSIIRVWMEARTAAGLGRTANLFCTQQGGRLSDRYVRWLVPHLGSQAGIQTRMRASGLRNAHIRDLTGEAMPVDIMKYHLGLASVANLHLFLSDGYEGRKRLRGRPRDTSETRRKDASRDGWVSVACTCDPPRRIRLTQGVHDNGPVICGVCRQQFQPA